MALASLDQNIVSTALPCIVGEFGELAHLPRVVTAFMLTATATAPLYGKLSDMHGRRPLLVVAIMVFIVGSALCGLARSMTGLILFRGVQGLGAGGLLVLAQTAIADLVPPRQRGRYQGLITGVFALRSVTGPVLGNGAALRFPRRSSPDAGNQLSRRGNSEPIRRSPRAPPSRAYGRNSGSWRAARRGWRACRSRCSRGA
jgi:MFS family permease